MAKLAKLPTITLTALQERIRANHYANIQQTQEWLQEQGYTITKAALHRYIQKLKKIDGFTGRANSIELLAQITKKFFDSSSLSSLYQKLGELEYEKTQILQKISEISIQK